MKPACWRVFLFINMDKIRIHIRSKKILADTITPVGIYLKLRDRFANSILLESSDYHGTENAFSYICCLPIANFQVINDQVITKLPNEEHRSEQLTDIKEQLSGFVRLFESERTSEKHIQTGLFGHINYDTVKYFDGIRVKVNSEIPMINYSMYRFIIAFDHTKSECHLIEAYVDQPDETLFEEIINLIQQNNLPNYPFRAGEQITSSISDDEYMQMVKKGIHHCKVGDVFQVVLSRKFRTSFTGDEFQVYRALRSINPSPYLFYFDYGSYKLFGSSPEAQLILKDNKATLFPIAGTFKRTGDDTADTNSAMELLKDPKEDSEHVMLVDLARNDLSRHCSDVKVETYKEIQYYSHVIHLVSKVVGEISHASMADLVADTFPAGTLSGAPKIRAMQIIAENEHEARGHYGGAVGFLDFNDNFNHAILIRSCLSKDNQLFFQAGAGIVAQSNPEKELQEVNNKMAALTQAIKQAQGL